MKDTLQNRSSRFRNLKSWKIKSWIVILITKRLKDSVLEARQKLNQIQAGVFGAGIQNFRSFTGRYQCAVDLFGKNEKE